MNDLVSPTKGAHVLCVMWDLNGFRHESLTESPKGGHFMPYGRATSIDAAELAPDVVARVYGDKGKGSISTDNGVTWKEFDSVPPGKGDGTIAVGADGKTLVWVPEGGEPFASADMGKTWAASSGGVANAKVTADRADGSTFYLWDEKAGAVLVSDDGGKTFAVASTGHAKGDGSLRAVPVMKGNLFLATGAGVFRSVDGGKTFKKAGEFTSARKVGLGKAAPGQQHPAIYVVGRYLGVYGFYRSIDGGVTWARINDDAHQFGNINAITGDPKVFGRVYLASANRGVIYGEAK